MSERQRPDGGRPRGRADVPPAPAGRRPPPPPGRPGGHGAPPPAGRPHGEGPRRGFDGPARSASPGGRPDRVPPQRHRPQGRPAPEGHTLYSSGEMPLLTHEETGPTSVARNEAAARAEEAPRRATRSARGRSTAARSAGGRNAGGRGKATGPWRRVRRVVYALLGLMILGPVLAFVIGWFLFKVPSSEEVAIEQVSRFTYATGEDLAVVRPEGVNRTVVRLDDVPVHVRNAVLAAENRSFYTDPGFDITGIMRAVYNQLTGGVGGGSTITQQYVKQVTGNDDFSLWRKYEEVVLAVKISREQTKDEILENYLNVIYLGRSAYGIEAASQAMFGKPAAELTVSEGAMIAGVIQAPSRWDPAEDLEGSQRRWNYVLDQMVEGGSLSPSERASQVFPTNFLPEAPAAEGIPADANGHIYQRARQEVIDRGIATEDEFATEGLVVTTTVLPDQQEAAAEAESDGLDGQPDNLRSALVSIDPRTGAIVAYYGGPNGQGMDYAGIAQRQPGSSFKPFVFAAALEANDGVGLGTVYDGSTDQVFAGQTVRNSEGYNCDQCSVQRAMTQSINTVFYRMGIDVGPEAVIRAAHAAGIPQDLLPDARGGIALGDQEVHPIDMASAFATLAADGEYREPFLVAKVTTADGRVLYERTESEPRQAFSQQIARNVTESMLEVPEFSGIPLSGGRPVAGKTGTAQLGTTGDNRDAWMVGYTPQLSTAVWVGTDASDPVRNAQGRPVYGRMIPGGIWQAFMNAALRGEPVEPFSRLVPLGDAPIAEPDDGDGQDSEDGDDPSNTLTPFSGEDDNGDGNSGGGNDGNDGDDDGGDGSGTSGDGFGQFGGELLGN